MGLFQAELKENTQEDVCFRLNAPLFSSKESAGPIPGLWASVSVRTQDQFIQTEVHSSV